MKNLLLTFCLMCPLLLAAQDVTGTWNSALEVQGITLRLVFHVEKTADGYSSTLDSPDQGATGIPTTSTTYLDKKLTVTANKLNLEFNGTYDPEKEVVAGTFKQNGRSFPMELKRTVVKKK